MVWHNFLFLQHIEKIDIIREQKQAWKGELTDQKIKEFEKFFSYMDNQDTLPIDTV